MIDILATDFKYDGRYLSDYNFIICNFDASSGSTEVDAGSNITFNKVSHFGGKKYSLTGTHYDECITTTFDICKNPDLFDPEEMKITHREYRELMRWLNRREFLKLHFISECDDDYEREICYYKASFNVDKITVSDCLYGLRLTMETDKPFAYGSEQSIALSFPDKDTVKTVNDISDEIGYIYPKLTITCKSDGDFSIRNETEGCITSIKNCKAGEVITQHGDALILTSSLESHDICNDFNYDFFKIGNTFKTRANHISVSMPCDVIIKYAPVIKDSP